jgi:hypothetical protein
MSDLLKLENKRLTVVVNPDCSFTIIDKTHGVTWKTWPTAFQDKSAVVEDVVWTRRERYWADV